MKRYKLTAFAHKLDYYLQECGKTTYQIATTTGYNHSTIFRYTTGEKHPTPKAAARVAVALVADEALLAKNPELAHVLDVLLEALLEDDIGA